MSMRFRNFKFPTQKSVVWKSYSRKKFAKFYLFLAQGGLSS